MPPAAAVSARPRAHGPGRPLAARRGARRRGRRPDGARGRRRPVVRVPLARAGADGLERRPGRALVPGTWQQGGGAARRGARRAARAPRRRHRPARLGRRSGGPVPAAAAVAARVEYPRAAREPGAIPGVARAGPRRHGRRTRTHPTGLPAPLPRRARRSAARALPAALAGREHGGERRGSRYGATAVRARGVRPRPEGRRPGADARRVRREDDRVRTTSSHCPAPVPPTAPAPRGRGDGRPGMVRHGAREPGRRVARVRAAGAGRPWAQRRTRDRHLARDRHAERRAEPAGRRAGDPLRRPVESRPAGSARGPHRSCRLAGSPAVPLDRATLELAIRRAAPLVRSRLEAIERARWRAADRDRLSRRLIPWVLAAARRAAARRRHSELARLDALVSRLALGMTAGEEVLLDELLGRRAPLTVRDVLA